MTAGQEFAVWREGQRRSRAVQRGDDFSRSGLAHDDVTAGIGEQLPVRRKGCSVSLIIVEAGEFVALTKLPQITPLEAAQIVFTGFGPLAIEQIARTAEVVFRKGLER